MKASRQFTAIITIKYFLVSSPGNLKSKWLSEVVVTLKKIVQYSGIHFKQSQILLSFCLCDEIEQAPSKLITKEAAK